MQYLSLPRPNSHPSTPFGRPTQPEIGLAKQIPQFSPSGSDRAYPSPPMSEPYSPSQRTARTVEAERPQYSAPANAPHRVEGGLPLSGEEEEDFSGEDQLGSLEEASPTSEGGYIPASLGSVTSGHDLGGAMSNAPSFNPLQTLSMPMTMSTPTGAM